MTEAAIWQPRWDAAEPAYRRKIRTYSRQHFTSIPGFGQDDLESQLLEVLWKCVQSYDPDNGATFNTFFWQAVRNRYTDLIRSAFRKKRGANVHTVSLDVEAVRQAIEQRMTEPDGEEYMLALGEVRERFRNSSRRRQQRILDDLS